ncbi:MULTISPECIES: glucuronyl esterase domain-containing protein [Pseudonocardia]|uniref:Acetylxylan esterase n=1 Tax=Pseudonocardia saturnea TaxID=33909 RepID=A0ABQ0RUT1_9PSEU|nr:MULTISPECIES: acetylxylan esterase [Pseudonocardia]BBG01335.1 acetylxylan esterase [Pseudonocardia autotrophica]GEC24391.1 acetylxylan esterase [Pseudonocardia saturnea]
MTQGKCALFLVAAVFAAGGAALPPETKTEFGPVGAVSELDVDDGDDRSSGFSVDVPGIVADATISIGGDDYPNPLRLQSGNAVDGPDSWENLRRPELLADFREHVYGQSLPLPTEQTFDVSTTEIGDVVRKTVTIGVTGPEGSGSFDMTLFVPTGESTPRGTFLMIDHRGSVGDDPGQSSGYAPVSTITDAGYAFAVIDANDLAPDDSGSYRDGVINLFHPSGQDLPDDAGRAISAWAWGASRAMDYLETDPDIDPAKVGVIGHSRSGKASLWAGAQDTRFAAVITNNSGSTGAKLARRGDGGVGAETVARINSAFPHWFPQTYREYNDNESALPVDQHELMALVAPRRLVVGSATDDSNADPQGEFLAYVGAARAYELYGLGDTGLGSNDWRPETDRGHRGPAMSYHLRSGGHGLSGADWDIYLDGDLFSRGAGRAGL